MPDTEKAVFESEESLKPRGFFGLRHVQFVIFFMATVIAYGMRTNLSVGVVYMTKNHTEGSDIPVYPEWIHKKNLMLSSFFWGYVCLQIGAGQLAEKYGPKLFLTISICIASVFSILIPLSASVIGYQGVIACRVVQGLSQGFLYPSLHFLLSQWTPLPERAKVVSFTYAGGPLGTVLSNVITGQIASSPVGWPVAFYVYGVLGLSWCTVFWFFSAESPSKHKSISDAEKKYIEAFSSAEDHKTKIKTPWKSIATSAPMWALLIAHCGQNWGFWTLLDEIPTYLDQILKSDEKNNGILSALPFLALWILSLIISPIADYLIVKKYTSIGASRKIFNSIGMFVPAAALVALSFIEDQTFAVALLVIAVGSNAAVFCGFNVNHIDLSPNHSGTLMGITNGFSNIFSIIAPLAIDAISDGTGYEETDRSLWTIVFCLAAGINVFVDIVFIVFGSGEIQPWNSSGEEKETSEKNVAEDKV